MGWRAQISASRREVISVHGCGGDSTFRRVRRGRYRPSSARTGSWPRVDQRDSYRAGRRRVDQRKQIRPAGCVRAVLRGHPISCPQVTWHIAALASEWGQHASAGRSACCSLSDRVVGWRGVSSRLPSGDVLCAGRSAHLAAVEVRRPADGDHVQAGAACAQLVKGRGNQRVERSPRGATSDWL